MTLEVRGAGTPAGAASGTHDDQRARMLTEDGRMKAILVADDDAGIRDLLRGALATADLARVALAEGDLAHATASTDAVLEYLAEHTLEGTEEPLGVYRTCHEVLRAAQDPRATDVLAAGHALLQERAAQFDGEDRRRLFLANVPAHLWLRHLWEDCPSRHHGGEADAIPPRVVRPM